MEKYIVNYHTGVTEEVEVNGLSEAKKVAEEGIAYTQENITIETLDGEVITTAYWYGISPQEDDNVLETVGGGFYQAWSDELGE
ncbi:hypothetical protein CN995_01950 [Bacillus cereus]|nr:MULTISPECIES: hypothetical protein [Bacillus cereus group]MBU4642477.1 hypothetical protein [Bacillus toyonensis]MCU4943029.1 hypothetical protein [Bacillus cereus]MCU5519906.1 hypothetical protein [Bacillus cereus]PFO53838.1 hypothetical protein COJ71_02645 [Bacillus cereus]PGM04043.1 hypothetical protein CN942_19695 [Bacillus thuringiensis]